MTEEQFPTTEPAPGFGDWVIITGEDIDAFPAGSKGLVTSNGCDSNGMLQVSRPAANGQTAPVVRAVHCDDVTTNLSWLTLRDEYAVAMILTTVTNLTGSGIGRPAAVELLAEIDRIRGEES